MNNNSSSRPQNIDFLGIYDTSTTYIKRRYNKGEFIFFPKEKSDVIYYITKGRVKIGTFGKAGKEILTTIVAQGEVFGISSLFGETKRQKFAQALETTTIYSFIKTETLELLKERIDLATFLLKTMAGRTFKLEERIYSIAFKDSRSRITHFILNLSEEQGQKVGDEIHINQYFTHQEIADLTSTSRQTVTMILNDLRNRNLLTFNRQGLRIHNLQQLRVESLK